MFNLTCLSNVLASTDANVDHDVQLIVRALPRVERIFRHAVSTTMESTTIVILITTVVVLLLVMSSTTL